MPQQLTGLGRIPSSFEQDAHTHLHHRTRLVRVLAQHPGRWLVASPDEPEDAWLAQARGRLRDDPLAPPVTGDWVWLDDDGAITAIEPRDGVIERRAAGEAVHGQVIAAGVDLALIAEPAGAPNVRRIERFAALAAAGGVEAVLVLTKADLLEEGDDADIGELPELAAARTARAAGLVDGLAVSARTGDGLGALRAMLTPGATAVLLGASGAGKSTLANALLGTERQATGEVREHDGRGRHTTVTRELIRLPWGALLLDTPGIRSVGMWDDGVGTAFDDIAQAARHCRFADCAHDGSTPGCAVVREISAERIAAWRKLEREQAWIDDARAASREREALGRSYAKLQKAARHRKGNSD